jgi:DNA-binding response OmpR family regulator
MNLEPRKELAAAIKFSHDYQIAPHVLPNAAPIASLITHETTGARILIAEDDAVSCQILTSCLQKWGYEVVVARDGHEAMTVMRAPNAPALVVLDWMMPGMDGIEVCRRLRAVDKAVYVILLTSLETKENILQALEAGADDYLIKPFDTFALQTRIRVGLRIIALQTTLADRVKELETAAAELQNMRGRLQMPL